MIFKNEKLQELVIYWHEQASTFKEEKDKMAKKIALLEARNELMAKQLKEQTTLTNEWSTKWSKQLATTNEYKDAPKMTYEQIIDLKCENARLREENAKFAKWQRILDKFKIF